MSAIAPMSVLYLVNAAEDPEDATYVQAEMRILAWVGKPVIVLLNQLGAPREPALEAAERARWSAHLSGHAIVRTVLALDAFARCWVQESVLLGAVAGLLAAGQSGGLRAPARGLARAPRSGLRKLRCGRWRRAWRVPRWTANRWSAADWRSNCAQRAHGWGSVTPRPTAPANTRCGRWPAGWMRTSGRAPTN
jgi:hypothetical protein